MKERLEGRKERRGERDVGKDEGGRAGELEGGEDGEDGREAGREGGRQRMEDALPGTHLCGSVGVSRLLLLVLCLQQLVWNDRSGWRGGGGD